MSQINGLIQSQCLEPFAFIELLELAVKREASDLHLRVPSPPIMRIDGSLTQIEDMPSITAEDIENLFNHISTPEQKNAFLKEQELDFAYDIDGLARFRVSAARQRGTISLAFRLIPSNIPSIDRLELPQICKEVVLKPRGLILITGPTGSGKSTTVAAMINHLNENDARNIVTIEDPIEYLHPNKQCFIAQRELGSDTQSFDAALIHALRHDPDVIVVGEMRDLATIETAIRAAETGHLVIGTLHTTDAAQTVDRIIDVFPAVQQQQVRLQLSQTLEAVISQTLLPRKKGGRIGAFEIMLGTPAVKNLIREAKTFELPNVIQLNGKLGMQTLDEALASLVSNHIVSQEEAILKSSHPERLKNMLGFENNHPQ